MIDRVREQDGRPNGSLCRITSTEFSGGTTLVAMHEPRLARRKELCHFLYTNLNGVFDKGRNPVLPVTRQSGAIAVKGHGSAARILLVRAKRDPGQYFEGKPVEKNARIKQFFRKAFGGEYAEEDLKPDPATSVYRKR